METQNDMTQLQSSPYASISGMERDEQLTMSNSLQEEVLLCEGLAPQTGHNQPAPANGHVPVE